MRAAGQAGGVRLFPKEENQPAAGEDTSREVCCRLGLRALQRSLFPSLTVPVECSPAVASSGPFRRPRLVYLFLSASVSGCGCKRRRCLPAGGPGPDRVTLVLRGCSGHWPTLPRALAPDHPRGTLRTEASQDTALHPQLAPCCCHSHPGGGLDGWWPRGHWGLQHSD